MRPRFLLALACPDLRSVCERAAVAPKAPTIATDQKMSWILRLENERILRDPAPPPPPGGRRRPQKKGKPLPPPPPVGHADLAALAADADPRIRRRSALALGRVGLAEGAPRCSRCSPTPIPMSGRWRRSARAARRQDRRSRVDAGAAGRGSARCAAAPPKPWVSSATRRRPRPSDRWYRRRLRRAQSPRWPPMTNSGRSPEADAVRLGLFALVRQKATNRSRPRSRTRQAAIGWWPVAYALQRTTIRGLPALQQLAATPGRYTRAFAARVWAR